MSYTEFKLITQRESTSVNDLVDEIKRIYEFVFQNPDRNVLLSVISKDVIFDAKEELKKLTYGHEASDRMLFAIVELFLYILEREYWDPAGLVKDDTRPVRDIEKSFNKLNLPTFLDKQVLRAILNKTNLQEAKQELMSTEFSLSISDKEFFVLVENSLENLEEEWGKQRG